MHARIRTTAAAIAAGVLAGGLGLAVAAPASAQEQQYGPEWSTDQYGPEWDAAPDQSGFAAEPDLSGFEAQPDQRPFEPGYAPGTADLLDGTVTPVLQRLVGGLLGRR